ncbi:DUF5682 family protein [Promineifilum sp.]|uniref:DUF5682 family protein n=1 Tax=Promineifilum sp. TaxID=2664178 RepID=UPI0035B07138
MTTSRVTTSRVTMPDLRVFGIRHHGPGSARALLAALAGFAPDCVLVEGPPDADDLIPWLDHPALVLPVSLLVYRPDEPRRATFYPFAVFSPEFQALRYALEAGAATGFMDLPRRYTLASDVAAAMPPVDPFRQLAAVAGFDGYELWWNAAVEQRRDAGGLFDAVLEMVGELRRAAGVAVGDDPAHLMAERREAAMRDRIRRAATAGHRRIASVCGAWHAPALVDALAGDGAADEALLRDLPAVEVAATWTPWTYGRLSQSSGYGAGIASPGWYDHLWTMGGVETFRRNVSTEMSAHWLTGVARLLRDAGFDVSAAHVIEGVRLAEALAALRGRPFPGLDELEEATQSVLCGGDAEPLQLIRRKLVVGERMGVVPPDVPAVPLQRDLQAQAVRLSLRPDPEPSALQLDLRQETDLERSRLLHRLSLLDIPWGVATRPKGQQMGTFGETWQLQWRPELTLRVIEGSIWGNTARDASAARTEDVAARVTELPELTQLIDRVVAADLPECIPAILAHIEERAALSRDVPHMLDALPPLAQVVRYGGLRQTAEHIPLLRRVFDHLLTRACLALPAACLSLDEAATSEMLERLSAVAAAVALMRDEEAFERWRVALGILADRRAIQPAVAGRATRLLHDAGALRVEGVGLHLARALSAQAGGAAEGARYAADWLDGFLRDSGLLLVHDRHLWAAIDGWLAGLDGERFQGVLPLLRRTFAAYPEGVRQQLQDRVSAGSRATPAARREPATFDPARAAAVLPTIVRLLGLELGRAEAER